MYLEPCQTSKIECLTKKVNRFKPLTIFAKQSILDVWQGSGYALDLLNCFAVVLRGIQGNGYICQTYYSIHSKQGIFPYSHVIHGSIYNVQAN